MKLLARGCAVFTLLFALLPACAGPVEGEAQAPATIDGKADDAAGGEVIARLEIVGREVGDGGQVALRLVADLADALASVPEDGDVLAADLSAVGSGSEGAVAARLVFDADSVGGFVSEFVDVSSLYPSDELRVRLSGQLRNGVEVDETFGFPAGETIGRCIEGAARAHAVETLTMTNYEADVEAGIERFRLVAEVVESASVVPEEGDALGGEVSAFGPGANPDQRIPVELLFDAGPIQGFVSGTVDTAGLLPREELFVRIVGALRDGSPVDDTFRFTGDRRIGERVSR